MRTFQKPLECFVCHNTLFTSFRCGQSYRCDTGKRLFYFSLDYSRPLHCKVQLTLFTNSRSLTHIIEVSPRLAKARDIPDKAGMTENVVEARGRLAVCI